LDQLPSLEVFYSSALLGLFVVLMDTYNLGAPVISLCGSKDMDCLLLHVKFEDGLSISVLRKKGNFLQTNWTSKPRSFKKGEILEKPPAVGASPLPPTLLPSECLRVPLYLLLRSNLVHPSGTPSSQGHPP
jgi:hypothetical protein